MSRRVDNLKGRLWLLPSGASACIVRVKLGGRMSYVGRFASLVDAVVARNVWLRANHGCLLNAWNIRRRSWRSRPVADREKEEVWDAEERSERVRVVEEEGRRETGAEAAALAGASEDREVNGLLAELERALEDEGKEKKR